MNKLGRVLTIAGSDSSGGAGIQADIKTITALGGYAASAITALTAQNTESVIAIEPVSSKFLIKQAEAALNDIGADCIKTGMLFNKDIIETVSAITRKYKTIPLIIDPVMVATSGDMLLQKESLEVLTKMLFPQAMLVTPNIPEAELLAHILITGKDGMIKAGNKIISDTGCAAVLVKGGHLKGDTIIDVLVTKHGDVECFTSPRINSKSTHGTGCTLASAIATNIAFGEMLPQSISKARDYVAKSIENAKGFGKGNGPLNHGWAMRS